MIPSEKCRDKIKQEKQCHREIADYLDQHHSEAYAAVTYAASMLRNVLDDVLPAFSKELSSSDTHSNLLQAAYDDLICLKSALPRWLTGAVYTPSGRPDELIPDDPFTIDPAPDISSDPHPADDPVIPASSDDPSAEIPHTMDEQYTFCKIYAFDLDGRRIYTDNFQDALVKLCVILSCIDAQKLAFFVDDPAFHGKLISYFHTEAVKNRTKPIPGTDLHVWVNLNANQVVKLMRKLLRAYDLPDIVIYLR